MAEISLLPEISIDHSEEIHFDLPDFHLKTPAPFVVVDPSEKPASKAPEKLPEKPHDKLPEKQREEVKFPTKLFIKKQKNPAPWHQPEQEFLVSSIEINPSAMNVLDEFLNKNLPNDPLYRAGALKFVEDVLLDRVTETHKLFNSNAKVHGFLISFTF